MTDLTIPTPADVLDAARVLSPVAVRTPLLCSPALDRLTGGEILLKCENLQRSGAFKFRGAYNRLHRLDRAAFPGGVVAYSTGNHGQAVATVGRMLDIRATIVMPSDAPANKIAKVRENEGEVVLYDRARESREEIAARIAARSPVAVVPPGDDPFVIAGQGTAFLEAAAQADGAVDLVIVPCGGGGLAAGTGLAIDAAGSSAELWAAEPEAFDDTRRSLESGRREVNERLSGSLCDALLAPMPAELPFALNCRKLSRVLTASDEEVLAAIRFAFEHLRLVVEPGGAVALAALLARPEALRGRRAVVVLSGGNVEPEVFRSALACH
jgi:threonine dehydratase